MANSNGTGKGSEPALGSLGPCCICGGERRVEGVILLHKKAPIAGRGWGCLVCHLPEDGAVAVVCRRCLVIHPDPVSALRYACKGRPGEDGRVPILSLVGNHVHDLSYHVGEW